MTGLLDIDLKPHFSRFLAGSDRRLHVSAHSHHPWPDITYSAQRRAWKEAAKRHDTKWDAVFGEVLPAAQLHIAARLGLPDPETIAFAPNTHEFIGRILSCFDAPVRILTTDAEFHSFRRQVDRLAEDGLVELERIPAQPFATFSDRFAEAAARGGHDLVFFSQVQFDSGHVVADLDRIVASVPNDDTWIVVDGYHAFMALPVDLSAVADRIFYVGGGYKYAMAGEGACFLHCPPGYGRRPRHTGWYAGFGDLEAPDGGGVGYPTNGMRFMGSTFDPSGLWRFVAVQEWLDEIDVDEAAIHDHVRALQDLVLERLGSVPGLPFGLDDLVPGVEAPDRGNFLTFTTGRAASFDEALREAGVLVDHRGNRIRFGLGCYHDRGDVDVLLGRMARAAATL